MSLCRAALIVAGLIGPASAQQAPIGPPQLVASTAAEASHILKTAPGYLLSLTVANPSAAGFALLYDRTTAPTDGSVTPRLCVQVAATGLPTINFPTPIRFPANGVVVVFSTNASCFTQTSGTAAFFAQVL